MDADMSPDPETCRHSGTEFEGQREQSSKTQGCPARIRQPRILGLNSGRARTSDATPRGLEAEEPASTQS